MSAPAQCWTITASRHRGGRTPYLIWTGAADDRRQAHQRAREALALACAAMAAGRDDVPRQPPKAHLTTKASGPDGGLTSWMVGSELHRYAGSGLRSRLDQGQGLAQLRAATHAAFGFGRDAPGYGADFTFRKVSTAWPALLEVQCWTLPTPLAAIPFGISDGDGLLALWAAHALDRVTREDSCDPSLHERIGFGGSLHSATLRASRAARTAAETAADLAAALARLARMRRIGP